MKFKRAEVGSQIDFSQVVLGNFISTQIRLMSNNPAIYLDTQNDKANDVFLQAFYLTDTVNLLS